MRDIVVYVYPGVAHRVLLREQNEVDRDELQMGARERAGADGMNSSCELSPRETQARVPRPDDEKEKEVTKMSRRARAQFERAIVATELNGEKPQRN